MGRKERVESAMRERLAELIAREVKDPRVSAAGVLGVSKVECTPDLSVAKVWISVYADDADPAGPGRGRLRDAIPEDLDPMAGVETFIGVALYVMKRSPPALIRDAARTTEIRARLDGVPVLSIAENTTT